MGTHSKGIFPGYAYTIYIVYTEYITMTEVVYADVSCQTDRDEKLIILLKIINIVFCGLAHSVCSDVNKLIWVKLDIIVH